MHWERNGFWLYYRRLERGRFQWPEANTDKTVVITRRELDWLLDGLPLAQQKTHPRVDVQRVV